MAEQVARLWLFCLFPWVVVTELTYIAIRLPLKVCLLYKETVRIVYRISFDLWLDSVCYLSTLVVCVLSPGLKPWEILFITNFNEVLLFFLRTV